MLRYILGRLTGLLGVLFAVSLLTFFLMHSIPGGPYDMKAAQMAQMIPQDLLDALPPAAAYEKAYFPTLEEVDANKAAVTGGWDATVGANVAE